MKSLEGMMPAREQADGPVLAGTTGSGGRVTAVARVLAGPGDFAAFQPGEVLVAAITTPAFTPLFALASAVVTDIGGVLSHGSIVAREYGIPAVLGTGSATRRIRTGDLITVDGIRGEVLLPGASPEATGPVGGARRRRRVEVSAGAALLAAGALAWRATIRTRRRR
jgi:pyruvate,water dikinase